MRSGSVHKTRGSPQLKPLGVGFRESYRVTRTPLQCQGVGGVPRTGGATLSHHAQSDADGSVGR